MAEVIVEAFPWERLSEVFGEEAIGLLRKAVEEIHGKGTVVPIGWVAYARINPEGDLRCGGEGIAFGHRAEYAGSWGPYFTWDYGMCNFADHPDRETQMMGPVRGVSMTRGSTIFFMRI